MAISETRYRLVNEAYTVFHKNVAEYTVDNNSVSLDGFKEILCRFNYEEIQQKLV